MLKPIIAGLSAVMLTVGAGVISTAAAAETNKPVYDEDGVRIFSKVPPPGVHHRVIFSPEDIGPWRREVIKSRRGKEFFSKRYKSRIVDELAGLNKNISDEDLVKKFKNLGVGGNHELLFAVLDAIYHQDKAAAKKVAAATASFARLVLARSKTPEWGKYKENIGGIPGNNGIPTGLGNLWYRGGSDFALAYDFLYNDMTAEQRSICRRALSEATKGLVAWGMNFPLGRAVSNWYGYHGEYGVMLLAIEGEEGFRSKEYESFKQAMKDFMTVHLYETGGSNEDGYTINTALREGQFTLIAMARRGENLYKLPGVNNYFKWLVMSLVPGEKSGETVGYSSNRANPYESAPTLFRWAMPGNPLVNYYFYQYAGPDGKRKRSWQYAEWSTMLALDPEDTEKTPLDISKLGLPLTEIFPFQGLFITRSDWSDEAAYLNMLARQDAWIDRHENVDRGRFVFAALGRRWGVDNYWGHAGKSSDHSIVQIDGRGQVESTSGRGKAPNGVLTEYGTVGAGRISYAVMDLSNAYNWLWAHNWNKPGEGWEPENRSFAELNWKWKRPGQPEKLHGCDNKDNVQYNFEGMNLWRKENIPMKYAWRSGIMVRDGKNPYVWIIDDLETADGAEHEYQWQMPIPDDLEFIPLSENRAVLAEKNEKQRNGRPYPGARRLLIAPMDRNAKITLKEYSMFSNPGKNIYKKGRVLQITSPGKKANFRILLYPYRTTLPVEGNHRELERLWKAMPEGAKLPGKAVNPDSFTIENAGKKVSWSFMVDSSGRTIAVCKQDGREISANTARK